MIDPDELDYWCNEHHEIPREDIADILEALYEDCDD